MHVKDLALYINFPLSLHELDVPPSPESSMALFLSFL